MRARVEQSDFFIACTGLDEVNIVPCGMANQLGSPETICFVSREDVLRGGDQEGSPSSASIAWCGPRRSSLKTSRASSRRRARSTPRVRRRRYSAPRIPARPRITAD
jgi:hypothetical protein